MTSLTQHVLYTISVKAPHEPAVAVRLLHGSHASDKPKAFKAKCYGLMKYKLNFLASITKGYV